MKKLKALAVSAITAGSILAFSSTALAAGISEDQAKEIAATQAGLTVSDLTALRVYKDYDDGRFVYEGEFIYGTMEYEFDIDANSGIILEWDVESIYD